MRRSVCARLRAAGSRAQRDVSLEVSLEEGRRVRVRPLRPADRERYVKAVAALSPRSRYLRFASPMPKMSERQVDLMMQVDGEQQVAYAALNPEESALVGVARYIRTPERSNVAEVAIAIADDWQGRGLGRMLLTHLIEHARAADLEGLVAMSLSENHVAARLSRRAGFAVAERDGIYVHYEMAFGGPTPLLAAA
jgi:RimJ/RimL family protein N-acetyltransferase